MLPLFMEVTHIMTALAVTVTIASSAVRPFGRPFKVTDKGGDRSISGASSNQRSTNGSSPKRVSIRLRTPRARCARQSAASAWLRP